MPAIQAAKSASVAFACIGGRGTRVERVLLKRLQDLALEHPHLLLRGLQALAAELRELEAALVRGDRLLEREAAAFHLLDEALQLGQGLLEAGLRSAKRVFRGFAHRTWECPTNPVR